MSKDLTVENQALVERADNKFSRMSGCGWRLFALLLLYLLYLLMGAAVFTAIEAPQEKEMLKSLAESRQNFINNHPCVPEGELDDLLMSVVWSSRRGVHLPPQNNKPILNWSFGQAFFFSSTIITTIGYGEQSPLSQPGKLFCIAYTVIGIPLTLLLLSTLVQRLLGPANQSLMWMNTRLGHLYQPLYIRLLHLLLVFLGVLLLFLVIPASILDLLESDWNWLDSFYYCFISLTTVGLGDFIPGDEPTSQDYRPLYKTFIAVYLVLGLMAMMLLMTIFTSIPELDITVWFLPSFSFQDPERQRLHNAGTPGPLYSQQLDQNETLRVVRARARRDDEAEWDDSSTKSQYGDTTPIHARQ